MPNKKQRLAIISAIGVFSAMVLFLSFNKHSKSGYFNYHSEIWADKAGYYVYLPSALIHGFNAEAFPDSIDVKTGKGFTLDTEHNKVLTKYTYGVALMQLPFFALAHLLAPVFAFKANGFSPIYHWSINVAAVFYLLLGLYALFKSLMPRFDVYIALCTVLCLFLGTNLYYYAIDDTGMSHVYSFALGSIMLHLFLRTQYGFKANIWQLSAFGVIAALLVIIRPTNLLFILALLFIDSQSAKAVFQRLQHLLLPRNLVGILLPAIVVILPQMYYWHYASGSWLSYTYGDEGFDFLSPKLLHVWFSPNNGLFSYTPLFFIIVTGMLHMMRKKLLNGWYLFLLFMIISYVFSSWWAWNFGCSFGARSYVEYLTLFSIPLAHFLSGIRLKPEAKHLTIIAFIVLSIAFNLKMTYSYDKCFFGSDHWDWQTYWQLIMK